MNEISFEDFSVQTILHKGVFSRIYLASKKNGNDKGTLYAIKSQQKAKVLSSPIQSEAVLNEQLV